MNYDNTRCHNCVLQKIIKFAFSIPISTYRIVNFSDLQKDGTDLRGEYVGIL